METILENIGLAGLQAGAGNGSWMDCHGAIRECISPVNGKPLGRINLADAADYDRVATAAREAFFSWRMIPAPKRGEIVRQMGNALRRAKGDLGALISLEVGKIRAEGEGEVQEMIDMADFAVGQSRMLYGRTMPSERPGHRLMEQWHPLGPVGIITAFNFPMAVWAWNAMIALVAGDTVIWKPSSKALLSAAAVMNIVWRVLQENALPPGIANIVMGDRGTVGEALLSDARLPLVSATGSVAMGRHVATAVAGRLGRTILELGGNNAVIVAPSADLALAVRAIVFGAVGTAAQRCTTTRRVIAHRDIYDRLKNALVKAYAQVPIGNPLDPGTLMGPLIDRAAVAAMQAALEELRAQGGRVLCGGDVLSGGIFDTGTYVRPSICEAPRDSTLLRRETFAPIVYLMSYDRLEEAVALQNDVPQGLSSALFTRDLGESEYYLSHLGSDCGIANVNVGTSGAEIGGAFGGEKDTGGGREAGSDAWKAYMRRQTNTVNRSGELPLAQGIRFDPQPSQTSGSNSRVAK